MMIKKITFDTYPVILHVFVGCTPEEIQIYLDQNNCTNYKDIFNLSDNDEAIFAYEKNSNEIYLRFREIEYPSIVAHEAFHVTAHIMRYVGIRLSRNSEEAYAYLLQYIMDKIYEDAEIL
jgi:hypothetical protein